jgi:hypothetical protein
MATCRMSRALQFFARAKIVAGPQQSNLEFSSRRKSPSKRKKGQRALTITPTGDAAFSRILCCRQYSSVSEEITDLQGLCVIAHTIQGTASPNCPHVRTILVAPREFRSTAECLCAKTFAGTVRFVVSEPHFLAAGKLVNVHGFQEARQGDLFTICLAGRTIITPPIVLT